MTSNVHLHAFDSALAAELASLRVSLGLSQGDLADELGFDQATISRVESASRRLAVFEAMAWLEALGLDPSQSAALLADVWCRYGRRPPSLWNEEHEDD